MDLGVVCHLYQPHSAPLPQEGWLRVDYKFFLMLLLKLFENHHPLSSQDGLYWATWSHDYTAPILAKSDVFTKVLLMLANHCWLSQSSPTFGQKGQEATTSCLCKWAAATLRIKLNLRQTGPFISSSHKFWSLSWSVHKPSHSLLTSQKHRKSGERQWFLVLILPTSSTKNLFPRTFDANVCLPRGLVLSKIRVDLVIPHLWSVLNYLAILGGGGYCCHFPREKCPWSSFQISVPAGLFGDLFV